MKKIIISLLICFLVGCSLTNTPTNKVESYLTNFNTLNDSVILDIDSMVNNENLTAANKETYKDVLKRQYEDLKYEIKDEIINGDSSQVIVKISVYDFYKTEKNSLNYMSDHLEEFYDASGKFSNDLFNTYRLSKMLEVRDRVDYEVTFFLNKKNNEWVLDQPDRLTLEKLNGLYDYVNG